MIGFCFFKQKTAYEMRISDWSSDVCSSDLRRFSDRAPLIRPIGFAQATLEYLAGILAGKVGFEPDHLGNLVAGQAAGQAPLRSEEHTSELQSLMRISYAVFCLKKKKIQIYNEIYSNINNNKAR